MKQRIIELSYNNHEEMFNLPINPSEFEDVYKRQDQELVSRIAATAKSDLQLPDEQLPTIERYVKRAISRILVFCGREDFPPPLEDVAAQIVEDMLRADQVAPSENDVALSLIHICGGV